MRVAELSRSIARRCLALFRDSDRSSSGQSLVETALLLPMLLMLLFNAVNFGYFFLVALNMAAAPRSGVAYSIQGYSSPSSGSLPGAGPSTTTAAVSYLTYQDMTGAISSPAATPVQVCSQAIGLSNTGATTQVAKCSAFGGTYTFPARHLRSRIALLCAEPGGCRLYVLAADQRHHLQHLRPRCAGLLLDERLCELHVPSPGVDASDELKP